MTLWKPWSIRVWAGVAATCFADLPLHRVAHKCGSRHKLWIMVANWITFYLPCHLLYRYLIHLKDMHFRGQSSPVPKMALMIPNGIWVYPSGFFWAFLQNWQNYSKQVYSGSHTGVTLSQCVNYRSTPQINLALLWLTHFTVAPLINGQIIACLS